MSCPGCGHVQHVGWCECGCLDDRTWKPWSETNVRLVEATELVLAAMPWKSLSYIEQIKATIHASGLLVRIEELENLCAELTSALTHYVAKKPNPDAASKAMKTWAEYFAQHLGAEI